MEEKRRLPSWMLGGASTTNKVSKPVDADASSVVTSEEVSGLTKSIKPKAKGVTRSRKKEGCVSSDENLLLKCETKRKKRRSVDKDVVECCDPDQEVGVEKRKRGRVRTKTEESYSARKKNEKSDEFDSGNDNLALSCDEEDDDLTMDDVLCIAKEFVENEKRDTGQQTPSEVYRESRSKSPHARSPKHEEPVSPREPVETTSEITLFDSINTTGDPAQDMLDLFLGPLLKKPIAKEKTSSTNDIIVPNETKNQQHAAVVSNKPVTSTKKKCSLRDAVAMFLD
ncbi:hypothetical protein QVD17_40779 [Tagetes erecta]|uniref:Uncharacterized protein n=1 Tax=Tagetes erecta TaxID=13708 RepID=A0AAD8NI38_TARER|nr:hypothetical protein QVD17_40779 [Tagetes erecta]